MASSQVKSGWASAGNSLIKLFRSMRFQKYEERKQGTNGQAVCTGDY